MRTGAARRVECAPFFGASALGSAPLGSFGWAYSSGHGSNSSWLGIPPGSVALRLSLRWLVVSMSGALDVALAAAQERRSLMDLPYYGAVLPAEAQAILEAHHGARLIDVRTRPEWEYVGRVPGAILIEWVVYPSGTRNPTFLDELRRVADDPQAPLLFICRSGQRSDSAARVAVAAGYTMAFNVLEGFEGPKDAQGHRGTVSGWRKAGLPWVQG